MPEQVVDVKLTMGKMKRSREWRIMKMEYLTRRDRPGATAFEPALGDEDMADDDQTNDNVDLGYASHLNGSRQGSQPGFAFLDSQVAVPPLWN